MKLVALVAVTALAPLLAACGSGAVGDSGTGPEVVTSFYPLQYVAQRVAGPHAQVENLTSPGAEPHDLELTVSQTARIAEADVAFYLSGFQPAVDEAVTQTDPAHQLDAAEVSGVADAGGDPHFWLDPTLLADVAEEFTDTLAQADPENAAGYHRRLTALTEDLTALGSDLRSGLDECATDTVVVSHDAFGHLERYGLHFEAVAGTSPGAEASPARVAELHELIASAGVTTVFSEPLASTELSETIAADLGIETAVLDPIEGLSERTSDETYLTLMRQNLAALKKANGCR